MDETLQRFLRTEGEELCSLNKSGSTTLVRRSDGRILVRKEIAAESLPVYILVGKLIDGGQLRRVPRIVDIVETASGAVVMEEYISGETVAERLKSRTAFSTDEIRRIAVMLCEDLEVLHRNGLVHRDLSANNVILVGSEPYILDFDIARTVREGADADTQLLGTPGFAAPEQYGFAQSDARTDIFSLGMLMRTMQSDGSDKRLNEIIEKCVRMDPSERYTDAGKLAAALKKEKNLRTDLYRILPGLILGLISLVFTLPFSKSINMALDNLLVVLAFFWLPSLIWTDFGSFLRLLDCPEERRGKRVAMKLLLTAIEVVIIAIIVSFL